MIGVCVHSRSVRVDLDRRRRPGSTRSTIAASGGLQRRPVERLLPRSRPASTSKPASRSTIRSARRICGSSSHDEDAPRGSLTPAAGAAPALGSSGSSTTNVVPCPGSDSTADAPPLASTKPARDRQAEPRAAVAGAARSPAR